MLSLGIQASVNSDDPGLFGYEGVTLDYVYAFGFSVCPNYDEILSNVFGMASLAPPIPFPLTTFDDDI